MNKLDPKTAYIRRLTDKNAVQIQLYYINPEHRMKRIFTFERGLDERIEDSIERMQSKVLSAVAKKVGTRFASDPSFYDTVLNNQLEMKLFNQHGEEVEGTNWTELLELPNNVLDQFMLRLHRIEYTLTVNYPYVINAEMPTSIMVGYDCYPSKLELQNTSRDECLYRWYKGMPRRTHPKDLTGIHWIECGQDFAYRVQQDDIDHKLKV